MRKDEIGSDFWSVPTTELIHPFFPNSTQWYLSGRSALNAIVKDLGHLESVAMPSWCCGSMIKPFIDAGITVHFYPVYFDEGLTQEIDLNHDALLLMDYFGYSAPMPFLADYKGIVIRDVTHSLFSTAFSDADFYFGSLRKWCGVWTGGFAWTRDGHKLDSGLEEGFEYVALRKRAMRDKASYINGKKEDKGFLKVFEKAEKALEQVGIAQADERDVELAQKLDVVAIKGIRRSNAEVLRTAFSDWLIFPSLPDDATPFFVPVLVPDGKRDALRRYLIKKDIYCPIHWPVSEYHRLDTKVTHLYENELSLICDQRYTEKDMNRIVEMINAFWKEA